MESRPPLLGLVMSARALFPHWLRVQSLSLREPSTVYKVPPSPPWDWSSMIVLSSLIGQDPSWCP